MRNSIVLENESQSFIFGTSDYYDLWWEHLAPKFKIISRNNNLLIQQKRFVKGLLSLNELRIAGWNHAWQQELGFEQIPHFKQYIQQGGWDYFRMTWAESKLSQQAFNELEMMGLELVQIPGKSSYIIDTSMGWENYLKTRGQSARKDFKRKLSKVVHLNPQIYNFSGKGSVEKFYQQFFKHHILYWTRKTGFSYFSDPRERNFVVAWAKSLEKSGQLSLQGLLLGDKIANLSMSCRFGKTLYFMKMINTDQCLEYYPGIIMTYLRAEEAAHQGIHQVDLGFNNYNYKHNFASLQEKSYELLVANPRSLKGKISTRWLARKLRNIPLAEII